MSYELNLPQYSGPLTKLLELIEERKLGINEISLAEVTNDFLVYLEKIGKGDMADRENLRVLADFIVIASRLILIKSRSLLPDIALSPEEESQIKDLEHRLELYRQLRPMMKHVARLWRGGEKELSRPYLSHVGRWLAPAYAPGRPDEEPLRLFFPGEKLSVMVLEQALAKLTLSLSAYIQETRVVSDSVISLEEKIQEVLARFTRIREASFGKLSETQSRSEIIITFLALLHLAREQLILLEQKGAFSDIIVRKNN